jgi:hypothetical protein
MPFARHDRHDDFAGFALDGGAATGEVCVVHLTWLGRAEQPGWPSVSRYEDIWAWLTRDVIPEARDDMDEELLAEILAEEDAR